MIRLPTLRPLDVLTALKRAGFVEQRQKGSHLYLWHPLKRRVTVVAMHGDDLPRPVMKQILKQAALTEDEFRKLF